MDPKNAERLLLFLHIFLHRDCSSSAKEVGTTYTIYNKASAPRAKTAMNFLSVWHNLSDNHFCAGDDEDDVSYSCFIVSSPRPTYELQHNHPHEGEGE